MLGGNLIDKTDDLTAFKGMRQLFQLNLLSNPVQSEAGYRNKVFTMFPSLTVLDGLDKGGKDAFNATSMANTTSRVPAKLFDTSRPVPSTSLFSGGTVASSSLFNGGGAVASSSLFSGGAPSSGTIGLFSSAPFSLPPLPARSASRKPTVTKTISLPKPSKAGKAGKTGKSGKASTVSARTGGRSMTSRAGLVFPVGRIRRHLKTNDPNNRLSKGSAVFLAAVL